MGIKSSLLDDGNIIILQPKGSLIGGSETDELKSTVQTLLEKGNKKLIIDMGDITYLNSSAIGVLTVSHATYRQNGGKLVLCNVSKNISNIFLITKLSTVFNTVDTKEDAIAEISVEKNS